MSEMNAITASIDRSAHVVLVVDDNAATRYSTSRVLRAAGFRTVEASSGSEALDTARGDDISAVVLDVHLPDIDGFEVCRELRYDPRTAALPLVHLSAIHTRDQDRVAGLDAGADGYLVHPVEPAVLVATVQALVRARMAEDRLRRSEARFRAVYDRAPSGIVLLGQSGVVVSANEAMARYLRMSAASLVGRRITELAAPEAPEVGRAHFEAGASGSWHGVFPMLDSEGNRVHLEWSLSAPVEPDLRIVVATNVTEKAHLEIQRRELLEREQAARAAAERHSRTKDDFIAVLSHEIRTPLNAITGWVSVLLRRGPTPDMIKGLEAIERNAKMQARIVSDILDVSRINSGKLRLVRVQTDPAELVSNSLAALRSEFEAKRLDVHVDWVSAAGDAWLDPERFQQIFWNLMSNAIKFSQPGGRIDVRLARRGSRLHLEVRDYGQGIRPEFIERLFERFTQSDSPGNRIHGGLGLGLAIVRQLVELHGGSVSAESEGEGRGASFKVELEVGVPADPADGAQNMASQHASDRPLEGLDILVVEDDDEATEMLNMVLTDRGASVRTASDCESALRAINAAWPDVLVSDIGLPRRDGYELIREVRARQIPQGLRPIRAIALTAFGRPHDRELALTAGFNEHLAKPLDAQALVSSIIEKA